MHKEIYADVIKKSLTKYILVDGINSDTKNIMNVYNRRIVFIRRKSLACHAFHITENYTGRDSRSNRRHVFDGTGAGRYLNLTSEYRGVS